MRLCYMLFGFRLWAANFLQANVVPAQWPYATITSRHKKKDSLWPSLYIKLFISFSSACSPHCFARLLRSGRATFRLQ